MNLSQKFLASIEKSSIPSGLGFRIFPILKMSCSRPPSRCASAGLALSCRQENRNKWLVRKATESQGEQQIFSESRSLGTLRGHTESQLLLGGGQMREAAVERAQTEKGSV